MVSVAKINKTIQLAAQRASDYEVFNKKYYPSDDVSPVGLFEHEDTAEYLAYLESYRALEAYLNSLDFEDLKDLQTLMYVGRGDGDSDDADESGLEKFKGLRAQFDRQGWNEQHIAVNQMTEKLPLEKYLEDGKAILSV